VNLVTPLKGVIKVQAVKGYLTNGWFMPSDGFVLPNHARVMLVIEEVMEKSQPTVSLSEAGNEKQASIEWLNRVEHLLELSRDEDLSGFPKQEPMKSPEDYAWFN
jgi:hypothetical protein